MNNILVINAGSSSLKYQLIDINSKKALASGIAERIGIDGSKLTYKAGDEKIVIEKPMQNHEVAIALVFEALTDEKFGVVKSLDEIMAVGHRVVHGGESFSKSVLIDDEVLKAIEANIPFAPLHNPANLMGIEGCRKLMNDKPMAVVFDTAFHQSMPDYAYIYGLPYEDYEELRIRRYGFHGTSHAYVSKRMAEILNKPIDQLKIVTCHLGNGSSVAAVDKGKSVDTSMGFTPLEGLIMGTRCGDLDPAIIGYLGKKRDMNLDQIDSYLNKNSGVMGISGVSSDFRDLNDAMNDGNKRAELALKAFSYRVKKYIGSYSAVMGGLDAIVFTGGIGENDEVVRDLTLANMEYLGVDYDKDANFNFKRGVEIPITKKDSKTQAWIIPTDEEMVIAMDTYELIK